MLAPGGSRTSGGAARIERVTVIVRGSVVLTGFPHFDLGIPSPGVHIWMLESP